MQNDKEQGNTVDRPLRHSVDCDHGTGQIGTASVETPQLVSVQANMLAGGRRANVNVNVNAAASQSHADSSTIVNSPLPQNLSSDDLSMDGSSSDDSHESFHSLNEQAYFLPAEQQREERINIATGSSISDDHHAQQQNEQDLIREKRNEEDLMREKRTFEEEGMVTLYSTKKGKSSRRHDYQTYSTLDDLMDEAIEDDGGTTFEISPSVDPVSTNQSSGSADSSVRSDFNESQHSISSQSNELRQRTSSVNSLDRGNPNFGVSMFSPNRARSYTSPDERSPSRNITTSGGRASPSPARGEQQSNPQRSILFSLDAGMAALRRWIVSRSPGESSNPRSSRAAQLAQMQHNNVEDNAVSELSSMGDEEYGVLNRAGGRRRARTLASGGGSRSVNSWGNHHPHGTISYPQTIHEEDDPPSRQRSFSEPESSINVPWGRAGAFARRGLGTGTRSVPLQRSRRSQRQQQRMVDTTSVGSSSSASRVSITSSHLESGGNSLPSELIVDNERLNRVSFQIDSQSSEMRVSSMDIESASDRMQNDDPNREARRTWILINHRFQLVVMVVGLIFSFLLFSIMVTWVVLTSAYVVSIDEVRCLCDSDIHAIDRMTSLTWTHPLNRFAIYHSNHTSG